jgi:NADPH:quinone reductase-like Zn-dependent oxidoreductase
MPVAGDLGSLKLVQHPEALASPPAAGTTTVSIKAIGLNLADVFACLGLYSATPTGSFVPGLEFSGLVTASSEFPLGSRVMGVTRFGAYTNEINVDSRCLRVIPGHWSMEQGAAFLAQALTAWYGLVTLARAHEISRPKVLIQSAAGGVGLFATEIVTKFLRGSAVCVVGAEAKRAVIEERGFPESVDLIIREERSFAAELQRRPKLDVVFDAVAGPFFDPQMSQLATGGKYVIYGAASFMPQGSRPNWLTLAWRWLWRPRVDPMDLISSNKSVIGFNLIWLWDKIDELGGILDDMLKRDWEVPHVGATFPYDRLPQALDLLKSGTTTGKVVVVVDG